jgi:hypothetical protein
MNKRKTLLVTSAGIIVLCNFIAVFGFGFDSMPVGHVFLLSFIAAWVAEPDV